MGLGSTRAFRPSQLVRKQSRKTSKKPNYVLVPSNNVKPRRRRPNEPKLKPSLRKNIVFAGANGVQYSQYHDLPSTSHLTGIERLTGIIERDLRVVGGPLPEDEQVIGEWFDSEAMLAKEMTQNQLVQSTRMPASIRHRIRRAEQYNQWQTNVIPDLIQPYMTLRRLTKEGREPISSSFYEEFQNQPCRCRHVSTISQVVVAIYWNSKSKFL
jgi:hypothetical protein